MRIRYEDSSGGDARKHKSRHKKYDKVKDTLGFVPRTSEEIVVLQGLAYKRLLNKADKNAQYSGALDLFRSYFEISLAAAIVGKYWMQHPNFAEYVAMIDFTSRIPSDIIMKVRQDYGRRLDQIPKDGTYWYPPNSKARMKQFRQQENKPIDRPCAAVG